MLNAAATGVLDMIKAGSGHLKVSRSLPITVFGYGEMIWRITPTFLCALVMETLRTAYQRRTPALLPMSLLYVTVILYYDLSIMHLQVINLSGGSVRCPQSLFCDNASTYSVAEHPVSYLRLYRWLTR
jgi:hypothetical protein